MLHCVTCNDVMCYMSAGYMYYIVLHVMMSCVTCLPGTCVTLCYM